MYRSLARVCPGAHLFVLCLSDEAFYQLRAYRLRDITLIPLADFEEADPALLKAKANRTRIEYIFTCTPCLEIFIFDRFPQVGVLTYLDADLYFFSDCQPMFQEFGDASIGIIPHHFTSTRYLRFGRFNVGWISFRRDRNAYACLRWWRERCLEWCKDVVEPTRFADQKYLDQWPSLFDGVHIFQHPGANVARWNIRDQAITAKNGELRIGGQRLIFFHFASFKQAATWRYETSFATHWATPTRLVRREVFGRYIAELRAIAGPILPQGSRQALLQDIGLGSLPKLVRRMLHFLRSVLWRDLILVIDSRKLQARFAGVIGPLQESAKSSISPEPIRYFCSYIDEHYLPQFLALFLSLQRVCREPRWFVLCLDRPSLEALQLSNLRGVTLIPIAELENADPDLARARHDRTWIEWVFTCKSCFSLYILRNNPAIDLLTYLDSDLYFFSSPEALYEEFGSASVGITPHRYAAPNYQRYGCYNAGWLAFRNDGTALACLAWWRQKCLAWCHDRVEANKYTDQKYIEEWITLFTGVKIIENKGANVARWNVNEYQITAHDGSPWVYNQPIIFFHFAGFNQISTWLFQTSFSTHWAVPNRVVRRNIFGPYIAELRGIAGPRLPHKKKRPVGWNRRGFTKWVFELIRLGRAFFLRDYLIVWDGRVLW